MKSVLFSLLLIFCINTGMAYSFSFSIDSIKLARQMINNSNLETKSFAFENNCQPNIIENGGFEQDLIGWSRHGNVLISKLLYYSGEKSFGASTSQYFYGYLSQELSDTIYDFDAQFWVNAQSDTYYNMFELVTKWNRDTALITARVILKHDSVTFVTHNMDTTFENQMVLNRWYKISILSENIGTTKKFYINDQLFCTLNTPASFPVTTIIFGDLSEYNQYGELYYDDISLKLRFEPIPDIAELPNIITQCEVTSLIAPSATVNCEGAITGSHDVILPITKQGTTVVTWMYDDGNGNTFSQIQNVVIDDTAPPVPDVPELPDIIKQYEVSALTAPVATDNCVNIVIGTHNTSLPITKKGITTITWTYDDGNGNTSIQTQNVVIDDKSFWRRFTFDKVLIYPNPSNGKFILEVSKVSGLVIIDIFDNKGELVVSMDYYPTIDKLLEEFDISWVASGAYHIKIRNGKKTFCKSIIIK